MANFIERGIEGVGFSDIERQKTACRWIGAAGIIATTIFGVVKEGKIFCAIGPTLMGIYLACIIRETQLEKRDQNLPEEEV